LRAARLLGVASSLFSFLKKLLAMTAGCHVAFFVPQKAPRNDGVCFARFRYAHRARNDGGCGGAGGRVGGSAANSSHFSFGVASSLRPRGTKREAICWRFVC